MGWALIAVIVALGAATLWVVARFDAQRTAAWRRVADELGYEFVDRVPTAELPGADILKAFDRGRWMGARNVLKGVEGPARVTLCDYRYSIGSARNTNSDHVTLCLVETPEIDVPACYARPQMVPFFDAIGKLVGRQNIEFEDGRAFSGAYVLQGTDEDGVRELFSAAVRRFFVGRMPWVSCPIASYASSRPSTWARALASAPK